MGGDFITWFVVVILAEHYNVLLFSAYVQGAAALIKHGARVSTQRIQAGFLFWVEKNYSRRKQFFC